MKLKKLTALEELSVKQKAREVIPCLLEKELAIEDAAAVAYNTAYLYLALEKKLPSPIKVLEKFSLDDIASLCESARSSSQWDYNESFKEGSE